MQTMFIIVLALGLRLVLINSSLWLDESIEALALMGKMGPLLTYALADYQPPLYHLIGYATTQLLGYSEFVLRLPSLVSGLLTVVFTIKISKFMGSNKIGYLAGLLVATNPLLIYYSQEGRTYAMTTFFVTAGFYYFLQILAKTGSLKKNYLLYAIFTILTIWTSYLSWFVLLSQVIYVLFKKRYDIFLYQVFAGSTLLLWLPSLLSSLKIGSDTLLTSPEWGRVVGGLTWKSLPLTWVKFNIGRLSFDNKILYLAIVSFLGLLHLVALKKLAFKKHFALLLWVIPPVLLGIVVSSILPVYSYFRVLFVLPGYLLLLALSSKNIAKIAIATQLLFLGIFWMSPRYHKEDWRALVGDLSQNPNSTVTMPSRAQMAPLSYYQLGRPIIEPSHEEIVGDEVYYIKYVEDLFDPNRLGQEKFAKAGYTIKNQAVYPGIQVDIYEKK